ncbi:MAG: MFS transporter [Vulcanimicrobiota bacterium]
MNTLLKNRNFLLLWAGQSVSGLGTWINYIGLNAYIYHIYGSGKLLGIFLVIRLIPSVFFGSLGGVLADRFDRKTIMLICDSLRAIMVLAFIFSTGLTEFFVIGFLLSALDKIFTASFGSMVPDIVEKENLMQANSLNRMSSSVITVIGPALGGMLIGFWGYKVVFIVDALSFVFSVTTLLCISAGVKEAALKKEHPPLMQEFRETALFLAGSTLLLTTLFLRFLDGIGSGTYNAVLPVFGLKAVGLKGSFYGYLIAFWGAGTFIGSMAVTFFQKRLKIPLIHLYCGAMVVMAFGMGFTFRFDLWYCAFISIFIGGFGDGISSVIFMTFLMEKPPAHLRGKIFGTVSALLYMMVGIGTYLAGLLLDKIKYVHITDVGSLVIVAGTLAVWLFLILRKEKERSL